MPVSSSTRKLSAGDTAASLKLPKRPLAGAEMNIARSSVRNEKDAKTTPPEGRKPAGFAPPHIQAMVRFGGH